MNLVRTRDRGCIRVLNSVERPTEQLVCFPHSGGTRAAYHAWSSAVPPGIELMAVQYPGRADLIAEAPAASVAELGARVAAELLRMKPAPRALFGHSLGALVAYETARALHDGGSPAHHLFVSGAVAPRLAGGGTTHRLGDDELWSLVVELGGIAPEVADEPELRDLFLPVLRSDISLHETYQPVPCAEPLSCPVRVYSNTEDPLVDADRAAAWAAVTDGWFSTRAWPGGHFRPLTDPAEVIADIVATLAESGVRR